MHRYLGTLKLCISNSCTHTLLTLCWQMYTFQLPWEGLYTPETQVCHAAHSRPPELHIWLARVTELQQEPSLAQQVWEILKTKHQNHQGSVLLPQPPGSCVWGLNIKGGGWSLAGHQVPPKLLLRWAGERKYKERFRSWDKERSLTDKHHGQSKHDSVKLVEFITNQKIKAW